MPHQVYLVTTATVGRTPFFGTFAPAAAAAAAFDTSARAGGAVLLAWTLMPDHVHWLLQLGDAEPLHRVVNRLKAGSARPANRILQRAGPLWGKAYHDHALRHGEDVRAVARYIVANPVRAGLARRVREYPFWNVAWL